MSLKRVNDIPQSRRGLLLLRAPIMSNTQRYSSMRIYIYYLTRRLDKYIKRLYKNKRQKKARTCM